MKYETTATKGNDGWVINSVVNIGIAPPDSMNKFPGERILSFTTSKDSRGNIETRAVVKIERDTGRGYKTQQHAFGLGGAGDYSKKVCAQVGIRATEKAVKKAHDDASQLFPAIEAEAREWYASNRHIAK